MKNEEKIVFAVSRDHGDDMPVIVLGIPTAAWEYMRDGHTHTFDLTKAGVPVKLVLFGAKDHAAALQVLKDDLQKAGIQVEDRRGQDFSIEPKQR